MSSNDLILLTGATGYVGGLLLKALEERGCPVRCMARRPEKLQREVGEGTHVIQGDVLDPESLPAAMDGVDTAYYMVHSMAGGGEFEQKDRQAAENFGKAASEAGVRHIIYLGGLAGGAGLSSHLASRLEVGEILRKSGVPTTEFQASIILGAGSLSFEMIRALVEKLPVMITPRWVSTRAQPIAIDDVVAYLAAALDRRPDGSAVYQIGGADVVSYGDLMTAYAQVQGLRRVMIRVPVLTPRLSSLWLKLVTPLQAGIGRKLIEGVRNETVVTDFQAREAFAIQPKGVKEAICLALETDDRWFAQVRWSTELEPGGRATHLKVRSRALDTRVIAVPHEPEAAFRPIRRIGGKNGWYYADWLWTLRGLIDRLTGGLGMNRGRPDPEHLSVGDTVDCWQVEAIEPDRFLRLRATMRMPGRAWLQYEVQPENSGSTIRQTAMFDPRGLLGRLYWALLYPVHNMIFAGMLNNMAKRITQPRRLH